MPLAMQRTISGLGLFFPSNIANGTGINAMLKWAAELTNSDKFNRRYARAYKRKQNVDNAQRIAKVTVIQEVYSYVPKTKGYIRSFALRNSITAQATSGAENSIGGYAVFSDKDATGRVTEWNKSGTAEAKLQAGSVYASFFLDPVGFNSFLQPRGVADENTFRPFMAPLSRRIKALASKQARSALYKAISFKMPRNQLPESSEEEDASA